MQIYSFFRIDKVVLAFLILFCFQLSACSDICSLGDESPSKTIRKDKKSDDSKKEIDWGAIAIADGGGASLGASLAHYSKSFLVKLASALGVGIYASYQEYERQKKPCICILMNCPMIYSTCV